MSKEKEYLEHKKNTLINLVNNYNSCHSEFYQFKIDKENLDIKKSFCSSEYCTDCGRCCKRFPCIFSPNDFLDITDLDYMRKILDTGVVTIVYYNNLYPLIIRARGIFDSEEVACKDIDRDNPCILHTENGCMLPDVYRGSEGLLYIREKEGHTVIYGEKDMGYLYEYSNLVYSRPLHILYDEYKNVIIPKESINEERVNQFIKSLINKDH